MNAIAAFNAGATGRGITVSVVDTGIDFGNDDLQGNISAASTDIVLGRNQPQGDDNHGTLVAGVIAAGFNNYGTIGVAYESTILSIRADISECSDPDDTSCFRSSDLANALRYATANGARVINLSLGGEGPLGADFENALFQAISAGVVIVAAAGNEGGNSPEWPGRYASDPRFAGGIIVVGSTDSANVISSFSNRAGVSASRYLVAPGEGVITGCDGDSCWRVNGTSFAAPHVAGALALLLDAFPNLSGRDAIEILLQTAADLGPSGIDVTYGRGLLDLARAFQPVGSTSTPSASGERVQIGVEPGAHMGGAFGDALVAQPGLATIIYDSYERLFRMDMGAAWPTAPRRTFQIPMQVSSQTTRMNLTGPGGMTVNFAASADAAEPEPIGRRLELSEGPWMGHEARQEILLGVTAGPLSLNSWSGVGGARAPFRTGAGDGFAALAQADRAVRGDLSLGRVSLSAETGAGDRRLAFRPVEEDASSYARVGASFTHQQLRLNLAGGVLDERLAPLGGFLPADSAFALPSETRFASVGWAWQTAEGLQFWGEAGIGRTAMEGLMLELDGEATSSTWRLGTGGTCFGLGFGCRSLSLELSQPLRIESGSFSALLADVPAEYFDPVTFSRRTFSASPSGRQIDLALRSVHGLPDGSALNLEAVAIRNEIHRRDAPLGYAFMARWGRNF
ncbi:S8 family peptidase [Brevundimonas sp.]|uniref:S8 family peptidase n=1 Tax=Brevundimonas sp. TaxID=1871086 RepID=UPI001E0D8636|nr:S8 family peptidase [Brevundimonas sp.]MBA4001683.1 peptidase S8 [Brevundimonas sp.]